jgi:hypothetical protein
MPRSDIRAGLRGHPVAVVDLAREPIHVVKVVAPGMRVSELL